MELSDVSEIVKRIWVGNERTARKKDFIDKAKINVIVNMTPDVPNHWEKDGKVRYYRCPLDDSENAGDHKKMQAFLFENVSKLAQHYARGDSLLIHCHMGIQRSASVALCLLMNCFFIVPELNYITSKYTKTIAIADKRHQAIRDVVMHMRHHRPQVFIWGKYYNFKNEITTYCFHLVYDLRS